MTSSPTAGTDSAGTAPSATTSSATTSSTTRPTTAPPAADAPLGRRIPPAAWRLINRLMRAVLSLPFPTPPGRRLMLVYLTGRKTGRHYRQPVSYVRHDGALLTPGGGNWTYNIQPGRPVALRINGTRRTATAELVTDPDTAADLLAAMIVVNPAITRFSGFQLDAAGRPDRDRLVLALQHGFCIVRWELVPS